MLLQPPSTALIWAACQQLQRDAQSCSHSHIILLCTQSYETGTHEDSVRCPLYIIYTTHKSHRQHAVWFYLRGVGRCKQLVGRLVGRSVGRSHLLNELREAGLIRQHQRQQRVRRGLHQLNRRFVKQQLAEELLEEVVQRRGVLRAGLEQRALRARAWGR